MSDDSWRVVYHLAFAVLGVLTLVTLDPFRKILVITLKFNFRKTVQYSLLLYRKSNPG